jgi:hypothetical protein
MNKLLLDICKKHIPPKSENAVISEGYIPYIPDNWNKILVLAESQNLSRQNKKYVDWIQSLTPIERMNRLNEYKNGIGIQPWDDGSLKLAIESALNEKAENTGVSNAILWSQQSNTGANINPSNILLNLSALIWKEFLAILQPKLIITAGKKAEYVVKTSCWSGQHIKLRLPAKTALSRVSGMFKADDLLMRYPEVNRIVIKNPSWVNEYKQNKIFYACHAVSIIKILTSQSS